MKILLLAGTGEARQLAADLADAGHDVTASLAGATKEARRYLGKMRVGGFGGAGPFEDYLTSEGFNAVIDATHPFASNISRRSFECCQRLRVPFLQILRRQWAAEEGDQWHLVDTAAAARDVINPGARVFLATGRQSLPGFANLSDCHLICRQIDPPEGPFPFPNGEYLVGRPPFSIEDEVALFSRLKIDVLVVKNAGGKASRSKLDAARELQIPVVMIRRPEPIGAETVEDVASALAWVNRHADH